MTKGCTFGICFIHTEEHARVERVSDAFGMTLKWSTKVGPGGMYSKGVVYINPLGSNPLLQIFKHELTHFLENSPWYTSFVKYLKSTQIYQEWIADKGGEEAYSQQLKSDYAAAGLELDVNHEIVANFVAERVLGGIGGTEYDESGRFINLNPLVEKALTQFAQTHQHWYDSILTCIKDMIAKLKNVYYRLSSKDAKQQSESKELEEIYRRLVQLKDTVNTKKAAQADGQFSIKNTSKMALQEQLRLLYKNKLKSSDSLYFGVTPKSILKSGLKELQLAFTVTDYDKSRKGKHNVPRRCINSLNENLSKAWFSFGIGKKIGFIVPDVDGDGKPLLIGIEESVMDRKPINAIKSVYGLDNPSEWISNQIKEGKQLVVYNEKEANSFLQTYGYLASVEDGIMLLNGSLQQKTENVKQKQFEIIQATNPMWDDYHTGIRTVDDIRTWEEVLQLDDEREGQFVWGDFSREDAEQALKDNSITVYSSYPIKNGTFVSTSYVQAQEYAGGRSGGEVYSKTIPLDEVAWINGDEGQYANVNEGTSETTVPTTDGQAYVPSSTNADLLEQYEQGKITREQYQAEVAARDKKQTDEARKLRQRNKQLEGTVKALREAFKSTHGRFSEGQMLKVLRDINKIYPTKAKATKAVKGEPFQLGSPLKSPPQ